jgi:decaprenylphospho-beta-D-erythro-pentofuranosid-2-ulose 2-reductase
MPSVLILGATSDIGVAVAKKFAQENFTIHLAARDVQQLKPIQSDLQIRYSVQCSVSTFDAEKFSDHTSFYQSLSPSPDIAICVFGYMNENENVIGDWNETLRTINVNYTGAVSILNIISQDYMQKKQGTIIGFGSVAGERGRQSNYIYGSAKAGFKAYLSGLRNRMFHHNVHVMTVLPGFVYTKMTSHLNLPKPLTAHPSEVATAVFEGFKRKRNIIYVKWFWKWIMMIIKIIPESIFKKKKL